MAYCYGYSDGFRGPTLRQRLLGFARAATLVAVVVEGVTFRGRVVSVDVDNFEMVLTAGAAGLPTGSIVNISFAELSAIAAV